MGKSLSWARGKRLIDRELSGRITLLMEMLGIVSRSKWLLVELIDGEKMVFRVFRMSPSYSW
jgi:hypothetical protein